MKFTFYKHSLMFPYNKVKSVAFTTKMRGRKSKRKAAMQVILPSCFFLSAPPTTPAIQSLTTSNG